MKKYYYNGFLIRQSKNEYAYAVCSVNALKNVLHVYSCNKNIELAKKSLSKERENAYSALESWARVINSPNETKERKQTATEYYNRIKMFIETMQIIKLEVVDKQK